MKVQYKQFIKQSELYQKNNDAKNQIRRPEIGCKSNKLADHKFKSDSLSLQTFLPHCYFIAKWIHTYLHEPNIYLDTLMLFYDW